MDSAISGLHHVTAITADAQANVDFYTGVLGLRLVKLTVNFDDPGSYHLYYGDELGRPGTAMTFFAWPGAQRGRNGPPQVTTTSFAVPASSIDHWLARLSDRKVKSSTTERFGERVIGFSDPDGMPLEVVGDKSLSGENSIRSFHGVTLSEEGHEHTAKLLTETMGFKLIGNELNRYRFRAASDFASVVDLLCVPDARHGTLGAGIVHHVAFRAKDDAEQLDWHQKISHLGLNVSPVMNRVYFHSIYYREPGGVLFEIATDSPGFTLDESPSELGTKLKLPPWMEPHRAAIAASLPPLRLGQ